jgi:hypothetical protein
MKRNFEIWLVIIAVLVIAILAGLWSNARLSAVPPLGRRLPWDPVRYDIEVFYTLRTVVSTVNATLLVFLFVIYVDIYRRTGSDFTIGLILFSLVLLLYALSSNPIVHWIFGFRAVGLGPFAMLPDLFTCVALFVMLYLTVKY